MPVPPARSAETALCRLWPLETRVSPPQSGEFLYPHAGLKDTISESNTEWPPGARREPRHTAVDDVQAGARGQGERPRAERRFWHLAKVIAGVYFLDGVETAGVKKSAQPQPNHARTRGFAISLLILASVLFSTCFQTSRLWQYPKVQDLQVLPSPYEHSQRHQRL